MTPLTATEVRPGVDTSTEVITGRLGAPDGRVVTYQRPNRSGPSGVLVWIHGGGLVMGHPRGGHALCSRIANELDVTVSRSTDEAVDAAGHLEELPSHDEYYVWLDARHRGVGTGALGPDTAPQHQFGAGTCRWSYRVR